MKKEKTYRVGIIGMGKGGMCLANIFLNDSQTVLVGVANRNLKAKGALWAKENGIYCTPDFTELSNRRDMNLIIDASGNPEVEDYLKTLNNPDMEIIKGVSAKLMWKLIDERDAKERETRKSLVEQKMLYKIGISLSSAEKSDEALNLIVKAAMDLLEMSAGSVALFDEGKGEMKNVAALGFNDSQALDFNWKVRPGGFTSHVLSAKKPITIENVEEEQNFDAKRLKGQGINSLIAVSLKADGKLVGILYVDDTRPRQFSEREINLMGLLGAMAATAIDKILTLEKAEEMALIDELTKVYNHRYFVRGLVVELKRAQRQNTPVSLYMIDVDDFKKFNDTHGHLKGNKVLVQLAQLLVSRLRQSDIVTRYGGEEFAVILPNTPKDKAAKLAEELCKAIYEEPFEGEDTQPGGKISVSMGVASFPEDLPSFKGVPMGKFIEFADKALYKSKNAGRNTVTVH